MQIGEEKGGAVLQGTVHERTRTTAARCRSSVKRSENGGKAAAKGWQARCAMRRLQWWEMAGRTAPHMATHARVRREGRGHWEGRESGDSETAPVRRVG